jgi:cyclase
LLFVGGHPVIWAGPVENWIKACDYILGLDVEAIVPGHGPIVDKAAVRELRSYFEYISAQARLHFDNGVPYEEAARKISLDRFASWLDPERIIINVAPAVLRPDGRGGGPSRAVRRDEAIPRRPG